MVGDISAILLRCIGEHQRSFGDASPRHQWKWGGARERGGGGVDLYKFLSWFMSVIFLYYFTCMFLSHVYVHFCCLLLFVQCTEPMGYPVKTSQNQNVPSDLPKRPIFGESKRPKYIFTIFNQTRESKHFLWTHWSKCPKVKSSQVKTSQSQNVPSQNVPDSKCPKSKRPKVKTSQSQNIPSENVLSQNVPSQNVRKSKRPKSKRLILFVCL